MGNQDEGGERGMNVEYRSASVRDHEKGRIKMKPEHEVEKEMTKYGKGSRRERSGDSEGERSLDENYVTRKLVRVEEVVGEQSYVMKRWSDDQDPKMAKPLTDQPLQIASIQVNKYYRLSSYTLQYRTTFTKNKTNHNFRSSTLCLLSLASTVPYIASPRSKLPHFLINNKFLSG